MGLSFEDSIRKNMASVTPMLATMDIDAPAVASADIMTLEESYPIAAYSGDDGNWTQHPGYEHYSVFSDDKISVISDEKEIKLHVAQFNIEQEENSQYIPFEMPRKYDGFDLAQDAVLSIHYTTKGGKHGVSDPINVTYNTEKVRFGWLIDGGVTADPGKLTFAIHADGSVVGSKGTARAYTWKTKENSNLEVIKSACSCDGTIQIDSTWVQDIVTLVAERVAEEIKNVEVGTLVQTAESAAKRAEDAAEVAESAVAGAVNEIIENYSTTAEMEDYVAEQIESADIAGKLTEYAKTDEVDALIGDLGDSDDVVTYVDTAVANVDVSEQLKNFATKLELEDAIKSVDVSEQIKDLATKKELQDAVDAIDVTEQLTEYAKSEEIAEVYSTKNDTQQYVATALEGYATKDDVSDAIKAADISEKLEGYYKKDETYSKDEIDTALDNVTVDLTGYATEKFVTDKTDVLSASVGKNTEALSTLNKTVGDIQEAVGSIDTSPRLTYDVVYNDAEDPDVGENVFVFYEIENEGTENETREAKKKFTIVGGSGGGSGASLKIGYITTSPLVVTVDQKAEIKYSFSGTDSSDDYITEATATWKINGRVIATNVAYGKSDTHTGENTFDVTDYLSIGTQKIDLAITDEAGNLATKKWTVQKVDVRLESSFRDDFTYPIAPISFDYTPYGAISKDIHFILDGEEIGKETTSASGIQMPFEIPMQEHGAHLFEVYMTASVNGNDIESNHIVKDIIWYDSNSTVPVIGSVYQNFTARQYDATNIVYTVYDPTTETPTVEIAVDGVVVSTPTLDKVTNTYSFKTDVVGRHTITITCGETVKTLIANIEKIDINITPVTAGLVFDFNPSGKSNNDTDRLWSNGTVSMAVSENFDWVNGGYQYDSNGDQYFCIKAGTSATVNYNLFADDAKKNGKEFKLVFKTTNVAKPDATFLSCMDNTTDTDHIGIRMDVHEAFIYGQAGNLHLPYSEEDVIEFEFNINKNTEDIPMVMGYEDGVSTRPMVYDDSFNFTQNTPQVISLGSADCDLHIYRFKVYNSSLTARGILNNFIADARNAEEMIARYDRNQIYDENGNLDPDILAEKCPWLRIYVVTAPYFTNNKSDKVPGTTIRQIYKNGDPVLDNWTCYDCSHSGQGTSSNNYGAAARNLDFIMNKSQIEGVEPYFILGDGTRTDKITMTRTSVPVAYLNAKVNVASSNNFTNAMLANRYNEFNPYKRPFVRDEGVDKSFIKDTMEFHNCVIFIQETDEDLSTHREFADTNVHFYSFGNIGDSKKTDKTRKTDIDDKYECCVEIMDVELPLSDFPRNTMYNAMGYKTDETTKEKIYTWAKDENLGILYELIDGEYVLTSDTAVDLTKTYYVDILEHDDFSEDYTYGWRYLYEGDDDEENAAVFDYCKQKWIELYRFITTSSDEDFKAHLKDYFVVDSALYYYLFTTRYCMVDNRAKNSFWHYGKTGEVDSDGNPVRKWDLTWMYDCDSSMGLNNYGSQVYRYGLEDIDVDKNGKEVFRESDSTFFCRIRDLCSDELKTMYNALESKNAWHSESFLNQIDAWQSEFPEELWRVHINRLYIRTYNESFINGKGDAQFLVNMANGKMKYPVKQWERSQDKYMASKYQSSVASSDNSVFRCTVPTSEVAVAPNYRLKLIPYAYMYLNVKYGTQSPIQLRAEPNVEYEIPFDGDSTDIIDVYSSSLIQSFGDLSTCYPATVDTSKASKIKELIIGNDTEGYDNPNLTTLTTGANYLLEKLNVENVSGLTQALNLSVLNNLRELYAHGSNIGGVTFADGGRIEIAELPAINSISMKNLMYLVNLDIADLSKLTTLTIENCSTIDVLDMLDAAEKLNRVRITGIDWNLEDTTLLERLYAMSGIDKNGYNTDKSVLTGCVHVPVIKQQKLYDYRTAWTDLEIVADTIIEQFAVTFKNADGSTIEVQYVDKGGDAVDPTTRVDNPITPTIESTVSHDFTFSHWDGSLTNVFGDRTINAIYSESLRKYTIKYVAKGITLQENTDLYGTNVPYVGDTPTYTAEEAGYVYHLFKRWDKSGFIDGDKIVNAEFDRFEYNDDSFTGRDLTDLSLVEIYAMNKLGLAESVVTYKDTFTLDLGNDVDYDDIESEVLISEKTYFDGSNYIDTGIQLLDEDKDFVLAIDYEFSSDNLTNAVLAQCYQDNGRNGFKLWYSTASEFTGAKLSWGTNSNNVIAAGKREVLVIRHKKGSNNLTIYKSNMDGDAIIVAEIEKTKTTVVNNTLVFGAARADDGAYENFAIGNIYWAKLWYADLGDVVCSDLAIWTHESLVMEASGFRKYYLTGDPTKRCSFTLLASRLLSTKRRWNKTNTNTGGWANSDLNRVLNRRLYQAVPTQIKALMKQVIVYSSIGDKSSELSSSDCYITVPALVEVDPSQTSEPYNIEGTHIPHMTDNASRKRAFDTGEYADYWTRSPSAKHDMYVCRVNAEGRVEIVSSANSYHGVLIEISF